MIIRTFRKMAGIAENWKARNILVLTWIPSTVKVESELAKQEQPNKLREHQNKPINVNSSRTSWIYNRKGIDLVWVSVRYKESMQRYYNFGRVKLGVAREDIINLRT